MASTILRADKDTDLYCVWSSVVEAPTFIGTRDEIRRHLTETSAPADVDERLTRADQAGTSSLGPFGAWGYDAIIFDQRGILRREHVAEFLCRYQSNPQDAYVLLDPFDDATEVRLD